VVLVLLFLLLIAGAVPQYLAGKASGAAVPHVKVVSTLKQLRDSGLQLSGWETIQQNPLEFGERIWSYQMVQPIVPESSPNAPFAVLLLMPQKHHYDRPQVEWTDLQGLQNWNEDSEQWIRLPSASNSAGNSVTRATNRGKQPSVRFFRGWREEENRIVTVAVLQWYAWPEGGDWSPNTWFWQDWRAQWGNQRLPWVAVSILVPIEPLGDIETVRPTLEALGQTVQQELTRLLRPES
jgi:cyanoexosortase B-associated protein